MHAAGSPGFHGLKAECFNAIQVLVITAHANEERELRCEHPKIFNIILLEMNVASHFFIEVNVERDSAKAAEDPNALVAIIYWTYFPHVDGATTGMAKINIQTSLIAHE